VSARFPIPRRPAPRLLALAVAVYPLAASAVDDVPPALAQRYADLARKGEEALNQAGPAAAIPVYEQGLTEFAEPYGRVHLRLAQLHLQLGRTAEAAAHFRACRLDLRVDAIDRDLICRDGFESATAPVTFTGTPPPDTRVVVVEPKPFAGAIASGDRLPIGSARLAVEAPGHARREMGLRVSAPGVTFGVEPGLRFAEEPDPAGGVEGGAETSAAPLRWPALLTGAAGLALIGAGLTVGYLNRAELDDIRSRQAAGRCGRAACADDLDAASGQATLADGLWMGGAGLTAAGVGLWFLFD
jgi:hypothetical protein